MTSTFSAREINLRYLIDQFSLQRINDPNFFSEWQIDLPSLTSLEKQELDRIQSGYFNLLDNPPLLENVVKLTIISPLLFTGGFYLQPYSIKAEKSISIAKESEGFLIEGRLDILILKPQIWAMIIESKQLSFSLEEGLAQLLAYMLADANPKLTTYGLITNGADFQFLKLIQRETPQYGLSNKLFIGNREKDLYQVLQILKKLSAISG